MEANRLLWLVRVVWVRMVSVEEVGGMVGW